MPSPELNSWFEKIRSSKYGEDVRDAIINAAKALQKMTGNANSLNGIPWQDFATSKEFADFSDLLYGKAATSTEPAVSGLLTKDSLEDIEGDEGDQHAIVSENLMNSGNLYALLVKYIRPSLAYVIHYENDPVATEPDARKAIEEYIDSLYEAKKAITKALKSKGYQDPFSPTFKYTSLKPDECKSLREFAALIDKIGSGTPDLAGECNVSEQGEYNAGDGAAYSSIEVHCTDYIYNETFNENKTYTAPEGKLYPKEININVTTRSDIRSGGVSGRGTTGTGTDDITEDGFLKSFEVTQNGHYDAAEYNHRGWLSVVSNVSIEDVAGMVFTVEWMFEGTSLGPPTQVQAFDTARFYGDTPVHPTDPSLVFAHWEPTPFFVVSDMVCEAKFIPEAEVKHEEIQEDWDAIIACRGADYDLGAYKTLNIGEINGHQYGSITFEKVCTGEDSSTSTWVSRTAHSPAKSGANVVTSWANSPLRMYLNGQFLYDLSQGNTNCKMLAQNIFPVMKRTSTVLNDLDQILYTEVDTIDTIWIPSMREMVGMLDYSEAMDVRARFYYNGQYPDGSWIDGIGGQGGLCLEQALDRNPGEYTGRSTLQFIESSGPSYARAYGECTLTTAVSQPTGIQTIDFKVTPNTPERYVKLNAPGGYSLRTYGCGFNNNASNPQFEYGGTGSVNVFPIGFCL